MLQIFEVPHRRRCKSTVGVRRAPKGGRRLAATPPPPRAPIEIEKETVFIYMVISDVLRDLPFIRDEPLKSADD